MTIVINPHETYEIFIWGVEAVATGADSKLNKNIVIFLSRLSDD